MLWVAVSTYPRIFPVDVYAINTLVFGNLSKVASECVAVINNGSANDIVGSGFSGIGPSAKGNNALEL